MLLGQAVSCNLESLFNLLPKSFNLTIWGCTENECLTQYRNIFRSISLVKKFLNAQSVGALNALWIHIRVLRRWTGIGVQCKFVSLSDATVMTPRDPEGPPFPNTNLICNLIIKKWFRSTFAVYFHNIDHDFSKEFYFHSKRIVLIEFKKTAPLNSR